MSSLRRLADCCPWSAWFAEHEFETAGACYFEMVRRTGVSHAVATLPPVWTMECCWRDVGRCRYSTITIELQQCTITALTQSIVSQRSTQLFLWKVYKIRVSFCSVLNTHHRETTSTCQEHRHPCYYYSVNVGTCQSVSKGKVKQEGEKRSSLKRPSRNVYWRKGFFNFIGLWSTLDRSWCSFNRYSEAHSTTNWCQRQQRGIACPNQEISRLSPDSHLSTRQLPLINIEFSWTARSHKCLFLGNCTRGFGFIVLRPMAGLFKMLSVYFYICPDLLETGGRGRWSTSSHCFYNASLVDCQHTGSGQVPGGGMAFKRFLWESRWNGLSGGDEPIRTDVLTPSEFSYICATVRVRRDGRVWFERSKWSENSEYSSAPCASIRDDAGRTYSSSTLRETRTDTQATLLDDWQI